MARYADPTDVTGIYGNAMQTRIRQLSQPNPYAAMLPGMVQNQGQQLTVMLAKKKLTDYMALPDDQKQLPQNKGMAANAALSLGIDPQALLQPKTDPYTLEKMKEAGRISAIDENYAKKAEAAKNAPPKSNFSPAQVGAWVKKIQSGKAILSDIPGGMSANSLRAQVASELGQDVNYDVGKAAIGRAAGVAGASAGARLTEGGAAQMTARTANAANQQLDILEDVSKKFPRSDIQAFNTPIIALDRQKYPEAQNWIFAINSFRNEYASALMRGHMPQEQAQAEVARAIPDNITQAQLESLIPLARKELAALVSGQMTAAQGPLKSKKVQDHSKMSDAELLKALGQ